MRSGKSSSIKRRRDGPQAPDRCDLYAIPLLWIAAHQRAVTPRWLGNQLLAHVEWWRAYYHFARPHESLRVALMQPRERGGQADGATLPAANSGDGSRQNTSTMDDARGAL